MALYDYDPLRCSPSDNPDFELELKEGSLVKVFGQEMADGFMVGEVSHHPSQASPVLTGSILSRQLSGRRGLVPATFVTEVRGPLSSEVKVHNSVFLSFPEDPHLLPPPP